MTALTMSPNHSDVAIGNHRSSAAHMWFVLVCGFALCALTGYVAWLSPRYYYGGSAIERPTLLLVTLLMTAGAVYLVAMYVMCRNLLGHRMFLFAIGVGILMRGALMPSTPILEDDFYRYLWDGAVTAKGFNPYRFAPMEMVYLSDAPDELRALAEDAPIERINHPNLGTIYPPVAQLFFAVASWIEPWSLLAWRGVLLVADALTLGIILLILRAMNRPLLQSMIYWWNPLLVIEIINAAHMDALLLPFVAAAFYFAIRSRPVWASIVVAFAAAIKIWPLLILPLLLRGQQLSRSRMAIAVAICAVLTAALFAPVIAARDIGKDSGFVAYGERWQMNDALFMGSLKLNEMAVAKLHLQDPERVAALGARLLVAGLLLAILIGLLRSPPRDEIDRANRIALTIGAMFMLSPTQFPWYFVWILPFLALRPRASLLLLTMMLPMYYLKFYYDARGEVDFFHYRLVWLEHAPVWILLCWEANRARRVRLSTANA